ncbi:MAG TPA: insulinase family protein, partial [Janthinobacterium sp.]|nr:insulinase family protein [Janthinobacterium sp.]
MLTSLLTCGFLARADEQATVQANPAAAVKPGDPLPVGPQVKVGKLANGLTYYIQKNAKPEKKVELRLVVKAGSILEDDDQQGLAHFTEHMAFNGSTHFKKSELISYLQSIGVKFGADLNAYTSFDETVYMLPIPTDKKENLDQGFLVLEDWAQGLTFNDKDIDAERAIVLEEARLGKGADDRMSRKLLPKLFNGSRYADRLPIGKEDIVRNFKYDVVKRFYRDWYRPDLMAVIVVGDVDPAEAEKMVNQHFGKLKNPVNERPRLYAKIPLRPASEGLVVTDQEATTNVLFIRYPLLEWQEPTTYGGYRKQMIESLYGQMLGARMQELSQQANPPFIAGGSGMGKVMRGYKSYSAYAVIGKNGVTPAIDALVKEDERARRFGFSEAELERSKKDTLRQYESLYSERDKSDSANYVAEYMRNFLEQEQIPGIENEYNYVRQTLPRITLAEVNQAVKMALPLHQKKLVVYMGADKDPGQARETAAAPGAAVPKSAELLAAVGKAEKMAVAPQHDKAVAAHLMDKPPKAGSIVAEKENKALGLTELTLSNGLKVMLKPTDFKNDEVRLGATRFGGTSLFGDEDIFNLRYTNPIVGGMGVKNFSPLDLQKVLAGKTAGVGAYLTDVSEGLNGSSGSADVETMLQLAWLKFTPARKDGAIYDAFIGGQRELAQNAMSKPESVFRDTLQATLYNNNPRVGLTPRPADFDKVSLDRVLAIYDQRFASAKGMTFYIVGSFDLARIKPLIATYLASLPVGDIADAFQDRGVRPVAGVVKKEVFKGSEPKSDIAISFNGAATYSPAEAMTMSALIEVMNIKLIEQVREKMGLVYGGGMSGALQRRPYENYNIDVNFPTGPENVDKVIAATFGVIQKIKDDGPLEADLAKVKEN